MLPARTIPPIAIALLSHKVSITSLQDIDDELLARLREEYARA